MPNPCHCPHCGQPARIDANAAYLLSYSWLHTCAGERSILETGFASAPAAFDAWQVWCTSQQHRHEEE